MWRRVSVAATLIVLGGCLQGCGPTGTMSCGAYSPRQASLGGATAISASDIWAVGGTQDGSVTEHWDGQRWTSTEAPVGPWDGGAYLDAISSTGSRDVWAVGEGHKNGQNGTLIEHWDGISWSVVTSPSPGIIDNRLTAVAAISENDAWAVGDYFGPGRDEPLIEHWNGTSWAVVDAPSPAASIQQFAGISAVDATDVWAVGLQTKSDGTGRKPLIEHWDGVAWQVVPSPNPGGGGQLNGVRALSASDVWAIGGRDSGGTPVPLIERWDGASWTVQPSPDISNASMQTIAASGPADVWIAGASTQDWLIEHWDGSRWSTTAPAAHSTGIVNAVTAQQDSVWAFGNRHTGLCGPDWALIERWDGKAWSYVRSPHDAPAS
ncbi:MAG: hypothetical protein E6I98_00955 [Chloroflexi bacterium]|nr:MAG: hypothetical protein E6I98_00955 [Chloroflexota bacterium]